MLAEILQQHNRSHHCPPVGSDLSCKSCSMHQRADSYCWVQLSALLQQTREGKDPLAKIQKFINLLAYDYKHCAMTLTKEVNADILLLLSQRQKNVQICKLCSYDFAILIFSSSPPRAWICQRNLCAWLFLKHGGQQSPTPQMRFLVPTKVTTLNNKSIDKSSVKMNASTSRLEAPWCRSLVIIRHFLVFSCPLSKRSILKNSNHSGTEGEALY